ncbi:MAG: pantetheine-phosphate adenylyltransferase [Ignavibacteriales bacterium]
MCIGLYAGSFDPFTNGHLYVLKQASKIFTKVIVVIAVNSKKKRKTNQEEMKQAIIETLKIEGIDNAEVFCYQGLIVDLAKDVDAEFFVRGLRNGTDFEYEENIALINHELSGINTMYLRAGSTSHISSSAVMEILAYSTEVLKWVPKPVAEVLTK